jgi:hypothetical protein
MADKKTKAKKVKKAESREVAPVQSNRRLAWGNTMIKPQTFNDEQVNKFLASVSIVYGVPTMGFTMMGDKPYLNKDGRLFLLHDFRKGKSGLKATKVEYLELSKTKDQPSICKVTLVFQDGHEVEPIGEASAASVKLDAVKQTLNMMAETRATNRAIWKEIGGDAWDRVAKNIAKIKGMSEEEKAAVMDAGKVSAEEMNQPDHSNEPPVQSSQAELEANLRNTILNCSDAHKLIDIDEKLQKSTLYSAEFKKEMKVVIGAKVDSLEK